MNGDWQEAAPCRSTDPEIFHPDKGGTTRPAKKVCAPCPYKAPCLLIALNNPDIGRYGVWGGLGPREVRRAVREWKRDAA